MKSCICLQIWLSVIFSICSLASCEKTFIYGEPEEGAVETVKVDQINQTSVTISANIKSDRGSTVTERGICWSNTTQSPTLFNSKTTAGGGTGLFTISITGLSANTTYYMRAYATNSFGTAYGNVLTFKTSNVTVGQSYQGGIVAYILVQGDPGYLSGQTHGLIATTTNQSAGSQWGCSGVLVSGTNTILGTGMSSTNAITASCTPSSIAAGICNNLVAGGYSDWYLPSRDEIAKMYLNRSLIGGFSNASYWTSSQSNSTTSWSIDFSTGTYNSATNKTSLLYVRAVRSF